MTDELLASVDPDLLDERKAQASASAQQERDDLQRDIRWLMGSRRGRHIYSRILHRCRPRSSPFSPNAMEMTRQVGRMEVGLELLELVRELCPTESLQMQAEDIERDSTDRGTQPKR